MLRVVLPDGEQLQLEHLCLDLNGTLACDGALLPGVAQALSELAPSLTMHLLTAGTHGGVELVERSLGLRAAKVATGDEKANYVRSLGPERVVAVGNGRNDAEMLRVARLGIAVVGPEGAAAQALQAATIVAGDPLVALGLLTHPQRLVATLRR